MSEDLPEYENEELNTEDTEITTVSSAASAVSHSIVSPGGGMVYPGGGSSTWVTPPSVPTSPYPSTWTTPTTGWATSTTPKAKKNVKLPENFTRKVLLAFLNPDKKGEEDEVEWSAILPMVASNIEWDEEGQRMTITFSMEDEYGNTED